jgi:PAS domain-containing protein
VAQEHPDLALTRQLASRLSVAAFLVDPDGALLYYNPPAETILGQRFGETGPMPLSVWSTFFEPSHTSGAPLLPGGLPLVVALREGRPAHRKIQIRGGDGQQRDIEITAFPLMGDGTERLGAVALFWETAQP